jgi:anaphase-promoting complex subunit 1
LEMCLGCAAISLSMVLAGTGDLETLRLLKVLRWRCDEEVNYGSHMAYGAAIGLLFLGGATCTLGREPEDIAALVMSFYPRYPSTTSDNQYHLQALRNLYALAVKNREIRAIDVDTGECVFVPVEVRTSFHEDGLKYPLSDFCSTFAGTFRGQLYRSFVSDCPVSTLQYRWKATRASRSFRTLLSCDFEY